MRVQKTYELLDMGFDGFLGKTIELSNLKITAITDRFAPVSLNRCSIFVLPDFRFLQVAWFSFTVVFITSGGTSRECHKRS